MSNRGTLLRPSPDAIGVMAAVLRTVIIGQSQTCMYSKKGAVAEATELADLIQAAEQDRARETDNLECNHDTAERFSRQTDGEVVCAGCGMML